MRAEGPDRVRYGLGIAVTTFTCAHCHHVWEDDLEGTVAVVGCTRCGQTTPFQQALQPSRRPADTDPSDAPTLAPTSPPPTPSNAPMNTPTPADPVSLPTIQVGSMGADDDSEAPTIAPGSMPAYEDAPTMPGSSPPPPRGRGGTTAPQGGTPQPGRKPEGLRIQTETPGDKPKDAMVGKMLQGYRIEGKLGEGGMGAVYRAHQLSLDREVAVKVLPPRYARSPEMVARFTREALSAAQLTHHNIIQVYDVGNERGLNYITMELVEGSSLSDAMRQDGRLQVEDAAGYVLQAARGLQYAHDRGIIHRDIKPANLMINHHGIIKIADMGLAKRIDQKDIPAGTTVADGETRAAQSASARGSGAAAHLTQASVAMGTPAYMAPEQGDDAASVDGRADQYSLGCTLYYLCTGHTPFDGTTAQEIISKHKSEPLPPLAQYVQNVPKVFEGLISKMMAKSPDKRFPSLKEVIHELELFLGIDSEKGPYTPREQHLEILERQCAAFYAAPTLSLRRKAVKGFVIALPVLFALGVVLAFAGDGIGFAGGVLGLGVMTAVGNFLFEGLKTKNFLFRRLRSVILGMTARGWAMTGVLTVAVVTLFWVLGWLWYWLFFAVVGFGLAFAYQRKVADKLRAERAEAIETTREMLKELRLKGVSEEAVQNFVCRFTGEDWEEFFEQLFGYEAMIEARSRWASADRAHPRHKFATWREPLVRWIERIETRRQEARENKELARVEKERLKAEGLEEGEAEKQAEEAAREFQNEQLHKIAAKDVDWSQLQTQSSAKKKVPVHLFSWLIRATVGLTMILAALLVSPWGDMIPAPPALFSLFEEYYYPLGYGPTIWGLGAGVIVLLTAFSRRPLAPWLSLIGALILVFQIPVIDLVNQPQFQGLASFWTGAGLAVGGFVLCILGALSGDRY